ncbi:MAG: hypothetical protein KAQ69_02425 [Spirochaetales bacterium]|nr:hypothetical protein [Spirochaetales bacterium]
MKLLYLLRKDILESRKGMMIYALTLFLIMLLPSLLTHIFDDPSSSNLATFYSSYFINFLFIGGFIITSLSFREDLYGKATQHNWLMLPASPLEKLSVKVLYSALLYPVVLLLFITASSLVIESINGMIFGRHFPFFNPVQGSYWKLIAIYIVTQSIFLLGAAYFRKASFIKTVLMLNVLVLVIGLISLLVVRILFREYFEALSGMVFGPDIFFNNLQFRFSSPESLNSIVEVKVFETIGKVLFWVFLAPFCWVVSYFRVREVQANDAI